MAWGRRMSQPKGLQTTRSLHCFPQMDLVLIGLLSVIVLQIFREPTCRWVSALWLESILLVPIPPIALMVASKWWTTTSTQSTRVSALIQAGALLFAGLVVFVQYLSRLSGLGDPTEIVLMMMLQYVAWYLIIFSSMIPSFKKVGFVTCCALVLFICFMSQQPAVFIVSFLFATSALWRLLSNYWSRLNDKALEGKSRMLPVSGIAIASTLLVIACTSSIVWAVVPKNSTTSLSGFSPFSGGDEGYEDLFARSGIGDGNMLSAGENASSAGPVESDQFIEDTQPSIYDVVVKKYSAATEIKKQKTRAVSLNVRAKHLDEVIKSEQSGKSFRTSRKPPSDQTLKLENRISKALFYVEGSAPVRFSIDCFHHFDGWDWSKVDLDKKDLPKSRIRLTEGLREPWYQTAFPKKKFLTTNRAHRIKILRLRTNALPAPPLIRAWQIARVNDASLFGYDAQGSVIMDGKFIPSHTMIDTVSDVPNYHVLANETTLLAKPDSPFSQIPQNESKSRVERLAKEWTQGRQLGWRQVEAIVNRLRTEFTHDEVLVATDEHSDSVESFLDRRGGPAYQFSSVATQILRAAGYKTRLKRGFLVQAKDYDRTSGQSIVTFENVHMWPEVCLDGWHWIPVEPTPGYPIPYNHLTLWQWLKGQASLAIYWVKDNPIVTLLSALVLGCLYWFCWELLASISWLSWVLVFWLFPSQRLKVTRKLIDIRFWAAGFPRPEFVGISDWFSKPDHQAAKQFCDLWQIENFSRVQKSSLQKKNVALACQQIVSGLSLQRIKSNYRTELT